MRGPPPGPAVPGDIERLRRASAALSPLERNVLALSAGMNLGCEEVASRLAISPRRAERLLASALVKMDRALREGKRSRHWWRLW